MDDLDRLEHLNLVSRVATELENHFGLEDKNAAEFVIAMAKETRTFDKFKKRLIEYGLDQVIVYGFHLDLFAIFFSLMIH